MIPPVATPGCEKACFMTATSSGVMVASGRRTPMRFPRKEAPMAYQSCAAIISSGIQGLRFVLV